jgi:hypothetical protein
MLTLSFPQPDFKVRKENEMPQIFDRLRKRWVKLTPEEWVRQNMISMLLEMLSFPSPYISVEKEIQLGDLKKRFDLLVYDKSHSPWMLIECKASAVSLNESTASQLLRYQQVLQAKYLIVTNGKDILGWEYQNGEINSLNDWPGWG